MTIDIKTIKVEPRRQTFGHIARRLGADKPASRYEEATPRLQEDLSMTAHTVRIEDAAGVILCQPGETIVGAMERTAMLSFRTGKEPPRVPVGCRKGGCGVCRVQVLDGAYRALPMSRAHVSDDDRRGGYALACCVIPEGDLAVRLAPRPPVRPTTTDIHANR